MLSLLLLLLSLLIKNNEKKGIKLFENKAVYKNILYILLYCQILKYLSIPF